MCRQRGAGRQDRRRLAGDVVEIEPGWVGVNGPRFKRSDLRRVTARPPAPARDVGQHRVASGEVWLFGFNDRRSWDSRYFGPVPLTNMSGELEPVLTW